MRIFDKIGRFFSDTKTLFGLICLAVFLPLAFFIIPTLSTTSATNITASIDEDPISNIVSIREAEVVEEASDSIANNREAVQVNSETSTSSQSVARPGNFLSIPGKVSSVVVGVGLDASGAISVPDSVVGMYNHGGAIFLDGHSTGVFSGLSRVGVGEILEFTLDSVTSQYKVVNIAMYTFFTGDGFDSSFMYDSLYSGGANGLNMMTCAGSYLPDYGTYSHRLVVFSVKI
jgi:Sortase (surface protein transpeptidase)